MDTTTAAQQAGVTTDTIRHWARIGAVAAVKRAGRWVIDAASLTYRITLSKKEPKKVAITYTVENMTAIGGNRWQRGTMDRVYFNNWAELAGIETDHYNTGNISWAAYQGEAISNSQARKLLGSIDKVYFDAATGKLHCRYGYSESRVATQRDVFDAVVSGIRTRIAAL